MQASTTRGEAEQLVAAVRERVLDLFPDGESTFELIYAPRFRRLIDEFARPEPGPDRVVTPFRARSR